MLVVLAALLPTVPWLLDVHRFGALQYNDYYGNLAQVIDRDTFTWNPLRWLATALLVAAGLLALRRRQVGVLVAAAGVVFVAQWLLRTRPAHHPTPSREIGPILEYLGIYLGWPFVAGTQGAAVLGLCAAWVFLGLLSSGSGCSASWPGPRRGWL